MSQTSKRTARPTYRRFFLRGLVVLLPSILTLWLLVYAYQFVEGFIAEPINRSLRVGIANVARIDGPLKRQFDPPTEEVDAEVSRLRSLRRSEPRRDAVRTALRQRNVNVWWRERWWMDLIGFGVAIAGVYVVGRLVGGYLGRKLHGRFEDLVSTVPVLRYVYNSVKQVVDFLISDERPIQFNRVVAVEYPRKGIWTVGLLTGPAMHEMSGLISRSTSRIDADQRVLGDRTVGNDPDERGARASGNTGGDSSRDSSGDEAESVTIFIPSSPTPFTGYTITVPRRDVRELPISIDEALRFVVSGGVLRPGDHRSDSIAALVPKIEPAPAVEPRPGTNPTDAAGEADGRSLDPPRGGGKGADEGRSTLGGDGSGPAA